MLLCFCSIVALHASESSRIEIPEGNILFTLSESWTKNNSAVNHIPKMDASDPLFLSWKRQGIKGKNGSLINAGLNIVIFNVPQDSNVVIMSHTLMHRRKWPFIGFLSQEKDGLMLSNSLGYYTESRPREDILLKMFVIHSIHNGKFVEIVLSATDDIFEHIEPELKNIIKSIQYYSK